MTVLAAVVVLACLGEQHVSGQSPDAPRARAAEVEALIDDLEHPLLADIAAQRLLALGSPAASALCARCIQPPRDAEGRQLTLWLPLAQAMATRAHTACAHALAIARDATELENTRARALVVVTALAPSVMDATTLQPLLDDAAHARLRAHWRLGARPTTAQLDSALRSSDPYALEAALLIVSRQAKLHAVVHPRLVELWDGDRAAYADAAPPGPDHPPWPTHLRQTLAAALVAVAPQDSRAGAALGCLLACAASAPHKVAVIEQIRRSGSAAGEAVPALAAACLDFDARVAHAAIACVAHLGNVAAPALSALEECLASNADEEVKAAARDARARLTRKLDRDARIADLLADLDHPTRWRSALLELTTLGPEAARRVVEFCLCADEWLWQQAATALGPAFERNLIGLLQPIHDPRAALGLMRIVDTAVEAGLGAEVDDRLRALAQTDADNATAYAALRERAADLRTLPDQAAESVLMETLDKGSLPLRCRAARLLARRARPLPDGGADILRNATRLAWEEHLVDDSSLASTLRTRAPFTEQAVLTLQACGDDSAETLTFWMSRCHSLVHRGQRLEILRTIANVRGAGSASAAQVAAYLAAYYLWDGSDEVVAEAARILVAMGPCPATAAPQVRDLVGRLAALANRGFSTRAASIALAAIEDDGR